MGHADNNSGATFEDARLQCRGDVNRVSRNGNPASGPAHATKAMDVWSEFQDGLLRIVILYTLQRPTSIRTTRDETGFVVEAAGT